MQNVSILSNHERAWLAHQFMLGEKIARFNVSQFYLGTNDIDIAEFIQKELFFII